MRRTSVFYKKHIKYAHVCPFCGKETVEGHEFEVNVGEYDSFAVQECSCLSCEKHWSDEYKLVNAVLEDK